MKFKDQMDRVVEVDFPPKRIVSLVPSQTELLYDLGLHDEVVGITKFCVHPDAWFKSKSRVGGTKSVSMDKIRALNPDLIIGNKEENERADIEALEQEFTVWMSDIFDLKDSLEMIRSISNLTNRVNEGKQLESDILSAFRSLKEGQESTLFSGESAAYFIWNDPLFCAGKNTFIDAMLSEIGLVNYMEESRYPEYKSNGKSPDFVFLSSEPYPFKEKHIAHFQTLFPESKIVIVDGEMFSWYGSRLKLAPEYFRSLREQLAAN